MWLTAPPPTTTSDSLDVSILTMLLLILAVVGKYTTVTRATLKISPCVYSKIGHVVRGSCALGSRSNSLKCKPSRTKIAELPRICGISSSLLLRLAYLQHGVIKLGASLLYKCVAEIEKTSTSRAEGTDPKACLFSRDLGQIPFPLMAVRRKCT